MPTVVRIVCLANSRKLSGRCLAGKEPTDHTWIRPVSDREHEEVSEEERRFKDGSDPQVLDVLHVPVLRQVPKGYQTENWLLDPGYYWSSTARADRKLVDSLVDRPSSLWAIGDSTYNGLNDRISQTTAQQTRNSLCLIAVASLSVVVFAPGLAFNNPKRRVQGHFTYNGTGYKLWITDPLIEKAYLAMPDGTYPILDCYLTISLGEPHDGYVYKLIAAVIWPQRIGGGAT